jgi:aspartyl-tRNA(Asn)/glutamyl-tRNA(Gln) amidotransferase subunit C
VAVTDTDVRHIAALARLGVSEGRIPSLVAELNGILEHMDTLAKVKTRGVVAVNAIGAPAQPLREDGGAPYPLERPPESFAPAMRDGFFVVPKLSTHEAAGGES